MTRSKVLSRSILILLAGLVAYAPSRLQATDRNSCSCSVNCLFGSCSCSAAGAQRIATCSCTCDWGIARCSCEGDLP